jgi:hypothetical protein
MENTAPSRLPVRRAQSDTAPSAVYLKFTGGPCESLVRPLRTPVRPWRTSHISGAPVIVAHTPVGCLNHGMTALRRRAQSHTAPSGV